MILYKKFTDKQNIKTINNYDSMQLHSNGVTVNKRLSVKYLKKSADLVTTNRFTHTKKCSSI